MLVILPDKVYCKLNYLLNKVIRQKIDYLINLSVMNSKQLINSLGNI